MKMDKIEEEEEEEDIINENVLDKLPLIEEQKIVVNNENNLKKSPLLVYKEPEQVIIEESLPLESNMLLDNQPKEESLPLESNMVVDIIPLPEEKQPLPEGKPKEKYTNIYDQEWYEGDVSMRNKLIQEILDNDKTKTEEYLSNMHDEVINALHRAIINDVRNKETKAQNLKIISEKMKNDNNKAKYHNNVHFMKEKNLYNILDEETYKKEKTSELKQTVEQYLEMDKKLSYLPLYKDIKTLVSMEDFTDNISKIKYKEDKNYPILITNQKIYDIGYRYDYDKIDYYWKIQILTSINEWDNWFNEIQNNLNQGEELGKVLIGAKSIPFNTFFIRWDPVNWDYRNLKLIFDHISYNYPNTPLWLNKNFDDYDNDLRIEIKKRLKILKLESYYSDNVPLYRLFTSEYYGKKSPTLKSPLTSKERDELVIKLRITGIDSLSNEELKDLIKIKEYIMENINNNLYSIRTLPEFIEFGLKYASPNKKFKGYKDMLIDIEGYTNHLIRNLRVDLLGFKNLDKDTLFDMNYSSLKQLKELKDKI